MYSFYESVRLMAASHARCADWELRRYEVKPAPNSGKQAVSA
jgi:hypothetical protein